MSLPLRSKRSLTDLLLLAFLGAALALFTGDRQSAYASPSRQAAQPTPQPGATPAKPILLTDPVADPQADGVQYFAPTGHTLRGSFLDYWQKNGGLAQFGYPITEEFIEPSGADSKPLQVQYFERNRFEHHPENKDTSSQVLLGILGTAFHTPDPPSPPLQGARYFQETGHNLGGAFKEYWEMHGGLAIHGYPISEEFRESNPLDHKQYTVQYFQRSRMEQHPENAGTQYEVLLGMLGTQLSQKNGYPYGWFPLNGRATDFSWIAGHMEVYCPGAICAEGTKQCAVFQYQDPDSRVQVDLSRVQLTDRVKGRLSPQNAAVVFGRMARPEEQPADQQCLLARRIPYYIAAAVQLNPAP